MVGTTIATIAFAIALGAAAASQTATPDQDHSVHHPGGNETAQTAPAAPPQAPPSAAGPQQPMPGMMPGMMMGGEMGQMMPMMPMMQMMMQRMMAGAGGMMGGPAAMHGFRRVEGQLAYVRTELRITEAQAPHWTAFADAVRAASEQLRQGYAEAMRAAAQPEAVPQHLERQIALLSARLDATRAIAASAGPLYGTLSDEQKRIADELMSEHLRRMSMRGL
jgi:hypothetical protein